MYASRNRVPLLAAFLVALLLGSILPTQNAYAQTPLTFDSGTCFNNRQNALTDHAQAHVAAHQNIFINAPFPSLKTLWCWNTLSNIWNALGTFFSGSNGLNPIAAAFWAIVWAIMNLIVSDLVNAVCQAALGFLNSAFSFLTNLLCLPLPHFNLRFTFSLGNFANGSCNGVNMMQLLNDVSSGPRPQTPGGAAWSLWNMQTQSGR